MNCIISLSTKISAITLLCFIAFPSPTYANDLLGVWYFDAVYDDGTKYHGLMFITNKVGNNYDCKFNIARSSGGVTQTCKIMRQGNRLHILSQIEGFTSSDWVPDNFSLQIEGGRMKGEVLSNKNGKAIFQKK